MIEIRIIISLIVGIIATVLFLYVIKKLYDVQKIIRQISELLEELEKEVKEYSINSQETLKEALN